MKIIPLDNLPRHPTRKYKLRKDKDIQGIVIHTTDLYKPSITEVAAYHIGPERGYPEIAYHDVITSRAIYHCVSYHKITYHAAGFNKHNIAIATHYKCMDETGYPLEPDPNMMKILQTHLYNLCMDFGIFPYNIFGHRELKGTGWFFDRKGLKRLKKVCPGMKLNLNELRENVTRLMQIKLFSLGLYLGEIDGKWGPKTATGFRIFLDGR